MPASTSSTFILLVNKGSLELVERAASVPVLEEAVIQDEVAQGEAGAQRPGKQEMVEEGNQGPGKTTGAAEGTGSPQDPSNPAGQPPKQDCLTSMWPMFLLLPIIYFLMIRPQQKQEKARRAMLAAVKKGEKVVTQGGIHAEIVAIHEQEGTVTLKIGSDAGQRVKVDRSAIARVKRDGPPDKT